MGFESLPVSSLVSTDNRSPNGAMSPALEDCLHCMFVYVLTLLPPPCHRCRCCSAQTGTVGDVKAAALDVSGPNTCVALFVGGGSSIETPETAGASKVLEYMAFSATKAR